MKLSFYGAVESVTGSCHLLEFNDKKVLLDCGQFQGSVQEDNMNFEDFGFKPSEIDYLLLSHAHIDHSGRLPLLVKRGFKGQIICTKATFDLCKVILLDSAHIHESEAEWKNRKSKRSGKMFVEPLYTQQDAVDCLKYFETYLYNQLIELSNDITIRFKDAGHILGSAITELWIKDNDSIDTTKIVFTGDLGTLNRPILNNPYILDKVDFLIMESTYGDRLHSKNNDGMDELINIILDTVEKKGNIIIPSFAVGRTQEIIYELNKLYDTDSNLSCKLRKIPVYIDSPLATKTTEIFKMNSQVFDEESRQYILKGNNPLEFKNLHFIETSLESKNLNNDKTPKIIISASGMCEAGRIKHHLKHNLWKENSSIVFVGYQAKNTLGRRIKDGQKSVKIFGEEIIVRAKIYNIEGFSGHADKNGLLSWLSSIKGKPKQIYLVHGETDAKKSLKRSIERKFNIDCIIPNSYNIYDIEINKATIIEKIGYNHTLSKSLQQANTDKINKLKIKVLRLKKLCDKSLQLTSESLKSNVSIEKYNKINNQLIDLEKEIMDLSVLMGD